jgi:hypothetical protein
MFLENPQRVLKLSRDGLRQAKLGSAHAMFLDAFDF